MRLIGAFHVNLGQKFSNLSIAFYLLNIVLAATPILTISSDAFVQHVLGVSAAIMLASTAMGPQVEITAAAQVLKRFSFAVLFPVAWMVLQIVPLPFPSLVNTIWPTASVALSEPSLWGHISLDPGATLRSLISYLTILSLAVATLIITKDRQRSETTLYVLSVVTTFMSIEVLARSSPRFCGHYPARQCRYRQCLRCDCGVRNASQCRYYCDGVRKASYPDTRE